MKPLNPADEFSKTDAVRWAYLKATDAERTARFYAGLVAEPWAAEFAALAKSLAGRAGTRRDRSQVFALIDAWRVESWRTK